MLRVFLITSIALVGCGSTVTTIGAGGGSGGAAGGGSGGAVGGGSGGSAGGGSGGGGAVGGGTGGGSTASGCPDEAKTVYVIDKNKQLSSFDPKTKTFHDLGTLACAATGAATPFSMAVDRTATAWVLYSSGEIFQVNTTTLACTKTSFMNAMFKNFGMGFSTDAVNGTADSLFISGGGVVGTTSDFARLDTTSLVTATRGTVAGWPELTGTGDAKLWGFFPSTGTSAPFVAQIDKSSAALGMTFPAASIDGPPRSWAFAFWGGRFWIFLARQSDGSTSVYEMNATTGALTTAIPDSGREIVGAGVSTCAPVEIN